MGVDALELLRDVASGVSHALLTAAPCPKSLTAADHKSVKYPVPLTY